MPHATENSISASALLEDVLHSERVRDDEGAVWPLHSNIPMEAGRVLQQIIRDLHARTTLEIGLAFGISALFICEALTGVKGARHIAIDPEQHGSEWRGIGLRHLREAGLDHLVDFRERPSHQALPELEREGVRIDCALVDGWHTFDYVMVDMFLVDRLLRVGGVMVIDDAEWPGVRKACRYFLTNRSYRVLRCWGEQKTERLPAVRTALSALAARSVTVRNLLKAEHTVRDLDLDLVPGCRCVAMVKEAADNRECFAHERF